MKSLEAELLQNQEALHATLAFEHQGAVATLQDMIFPCIKV
jgi:hypothetical protein